MLVINPDYLLVIIMDTKKINPQLNLLILEPGLKVVILVKIDYTVIIITVEIIRIALLEIDLDTRAEIMLGQGLTMLGFLLIILILGYHLG